MFEQPIGHLLEHETDVFEAIEAASRNYNVDRARIVLRGMSMGASGTELFWLFRIPNALPSIFAGLKVASVLSVIGRSGSGAQAQ